MSHAKVPTFPSQGAQERENWQNSQPSGLGSEMGLLRAKQWREKQMRENQEGSTHPVDERSVSFTMCPFSTWWTDRTKMETLKSCKIKERRKHITQVSEELIFGKTLLKQTEGKKQGETAWNLKCWLKAFANTLIKTIIKKNSNQP